MSDLNKIKNKITDAMEDFAMLKPNDTVIIGVSGGADSMALLHFLHETCNLHLKIIAAHVNHNLRGEESFRDESFVKDYCNKHKIKCEVLSVDVKSEANRKKMGVEECARFIRYKFFYELTDKYNAKLATAHTLSDVSETLIFNLIRGCGLKGLCSIPSKVGILIRPLIYIKRSEVEYYCRSNGLDYITDSTNVDINFSRNRIRHNIIPEIKKINPQFESAVLRLISNISYDDAYLNDLAKRKFNKISNNDGIFLKNLSGLPKPILSRVIRIFIGSNYNLESKHMDLISKMIAQKTGAVNLPGNKKIYVENNLLKIDSVIEHNKKITSWEYNFKETNSLTVGNKTFIIKTISRKEFNAYPYKNKILFKNSVDYAKINCNTVFRNRREKDKFKKAGSSITKTLKKLFNEYKIKPEIRDSILILETDGKIIWIEGFGASDEAKVSKHSKFVTLILPGGDKNV